jgi:hypothetical protein
MRTSSRGDRQARPRCLLRLNRPYPGRGCLRVILSLIPSPAPQLISSIYIKLMRMTMRTPLASSFFVDKSLPPGRYRTAKKIMMGRTSTEIHLPLRYTGDESETRSYWHVSEKRKKLVLARSTQRLIGTETTRQTSFTNNPAGRKGRARIDQVLMLKGNPHIRRRRRRNPLPTRPTRLARRATSIRTHCLSCRIVSWPMTTRNSYAYISYG